MSATSPSWGHSEASVDWRPRSPDASPVQFNVGVAGQVNGSGAAQPVHCAYSESDGPKDFWQFFFGALPLLGPAINAMASAGWL